MKQLFGDVENVAHFLELILVLIVDFKVLKVMKFGLCYCSIKTITKRTWYEGG